MSTWILILVISDVAVRVDTYPSLAACRDAAMTFEQGNTAGRERGVAHPGNGLDFACVKAGARQ